MAVAVYKTYVSGEILTAADLNGSFLQIHNNGDDLASPATKNHDMDGFGIIMDPDADSNIKASTDDRLDITLGGVSLFRFNGTTASSVNGLDFMSSATLNAVRVMAVGTDANISINLVPKGSGELQLNGTAILTTIAGVGTQDYVVLAGQVFH